MALRGIPSYSASSGICAMVMPPSSLMDFSPTVPSEPVPERTMHIARALVRFAERAEEEVDRRMSIALGRRR